MKLCFSTLGCSDLSLEDIVCLAKAYGISAIEVRGIGGVLNNVEIEAFTEKKRNNTALFLQQNAISPVTLGTSCSFHNAEKFDTTISEGLASVEIAKELGFKNIRVFGDKLTQDADACIDRITSGISRLCSVSGDVNVLLEVHGDFNTVEALSPIIQSLSHFKNFGLIWDIEHSHRVYGRDWHKFYDFVRPYVKHVHIKDRSDTPNKLTLVGDGDIPITDICKKLLSDGYDGYFSLEWEKKWHPELPEMSCALQSFIKIMGEV